MEVAVVATIFAVGNILFGHWLLKFGIVLALTILPHNLWAPLGVSVRRHARPRRCDSSRLLVTAAIRHQWMDWRAEGKVLRAKRVEVSTGGLNMRAA